LYLLYGTTYSFLLSHQWKIKDDLIAEHFFKQTIMKNWKIKLRIKPKIFNSITGESGEKKIKNARKINRLFDETL